MMMPSPPLSTLLVFFKVMANESRLKLVGLLAQREHSVEELAALLQLKEPTVSHHLNKLKSLDLVQMRQAGNLHFYQLNQAALQHLTKAILTADQMASLTADVKGDAWEDKVLRSYLEEGRLREIPASRKKRWVILKWLVHQLEVDRRYPERSLNQQLKQFHPDTATLRRELIGYRMMQRENGYYWRLPESDWQGEGQ